MSAAVILELVEEVISSKTKITDLLLKRKCSEKGKLLGRIVKTREITITEKEKKDIMRESLSQVFFPGRYSLEDKLKLESAVGRELSRRKSQRHEDSNSLFESAMVKLKQKGEVQVLEKEELESLEQQLRQEEEYRLAIDLLVQAKRIIRTRHGDLFIYNAAGEE